jgi:hypothetical protein
MRIKTITWITTVALMTACGENPTTKTQKGVVGGDTDEGRDDSRTFYPNPDQDNDGDGFTLRDDCDDRDASVFPGAVERCNGVDDDCNGSVDERTAVGGTAWFVDRDGDGYGNPDTPILACEGPEAYVADGSDCDDTDRTARPDAPEICGDDVDNDCDGVETACTAGAVVGDVVISSPDGMADLCTDSDAIDGNLMVRGDRISDLDGLACLQKVSGNVVISSTTVTDLQGLRHLYLVGGNLHIAQNDALVNLEGLDELHSVQGDVTFNAPALTSLAGIEALTSIGGALHIDSERLTTLDGLGSLSKVHGLYLGLPSVDTLEGLDSLEEIDGDLVVDGTYGLPVTDAPIAFAERIPNMDLVDLNGLWRISRISGDMVLKNLEGMSDLTGMEGLDSMEGRLELTSMSGLESLKGLEQLTDIGGLKVHGSPLLASMQGLDGLVRVDGDLQLSSNESMDDVDALYGIEDVTGDITLVNLPSLSRAAAERLVESVGGDVSDAEIDL